MKHIARIRWSWLRCPLLAIYLPFLIIDFALYALWREPRALLRPGVFDAPVGLFWAAWDGSMVGR